MFLHLVWVIVAERRDALHLGLRHLLREGPLPGNLGLTGEPHLHAVGRVARHFDELRVGQVEDAAADAVVGHAGVPVPPGLVGVPPRHRTDHVAVPADHGHGVNYEDGYGCQGFWARHFGLSEDNSCILWTDLSCLICGQSVDKSLRLVRSVLNEDA